MIDDDHLVDGRRRKLGRDGVDAGSEDRDLDGRAGLLSGSNRFPRRAIERPIALLGDDKSHERTLASSRSFATSCLAASAAEPEIICVCLAFSGNDTLRIR